MILESIVRKRRYFDPRSKKDVESAKKFFQTYSWGHDNGCPFILEYPYHSVPDMIKNKLLFRFLNIEEVKYEGHY